MAFASDPPLSVTGNSTIICSTLCTSAINLTTTFNDPPAPRNLIRWKIYQLSWDNILPRRINLEDNAKG